MKNFAVYLQIDQRSDDLKCMWEPHSYRKTATQDVSRVGFISAIFRSKLYQNKNVRDDFYILLFLYILRNNLFSIKMDLYM